MALDRGSGNAGVRRQNSRRWKFLFQNFLQRSVFPFMAKLGDRSAKMTKSEPTENPRQLSLADFELRFRLMPACVQKQSVCTSEALHHEFSAEHTGQFA
jgi:hypothetical protein